MKLILSVILSWIVPGGGHFFLGERKRAWIFFVVITLTFWTGIYIGGVLSTVNFQTNTPWFFAQVFLGGYTSLTEILSLFGATASYGKTLDLATIYTGVAGLLNILVILDAAVRATTQQTKDGETG